MAGLLPTAPDPSMQPLGLPHMPSSLQRADPMLRITVEADGFQALPVARHGGILDP